MTHRNDPRLFVSIRIRFFQITFKPLKLSSNLMPAVVNEEIKFGRKSDHMSRTNVERVEEVVLHSTTFIFSAVDHGESIVEIGKVAVWLQNDIK